MPNNNHKKTKKKKTELARKYPRLKVYPECQFSLFRFHYYGRNTGDRSFGTFKRNTKY